ncbi:MAG: MFS transporter [Eubacteriales bacterium]
MSAQEVSSKESQEKTHQQNEDHKRLKRLKVLWPTAELTGGFNKAYFATYAQYLYTDVYRFSVSFTGVLSLVQTITGWIGGPIFGAFLDRFNFKKAKFWPWLISGVLVVYTAWMLLFSLPVFGLSGGGLATFAFFLAVLIAVSQPIATIPVTACYPRISTNPKDRQFLAMGQKIGRDGGKTLFGYLVPVMLVYFAAQSNESNSYAFVAIIIGLLTILGYGSLAIFGLRGSYVERNAIAESFEASGIKKKKLPLPLLIKAIFTNRALLGMYLFMAIHKTYYFIWVTCAAYILKYVFGDFSQMSLFMTMFNFTAIIGVMFGPGWSKIFKETKKSFVSCMIVHTAILVITAVFFKNLSIGVYLVFFGAGSFFAGMLENYIMPMFAASADYGAWKTGSRIDGMTMSIYSLTITSGTLFATIIRTAVLNAMNYDAAVAIVDSGGAVPTEVFNGLSTLFTVFPAGLAIVSLLCLIFIMPLTDDKLAKINGDLKVGKTMETSQYKF